MGDLTQKARDDLLARIESQGVMAAFDLLVTGMGGLGVFELSPNILGRKKSLHFKSGKVSYFAFVANNAWLLWYFRRPGLRDGIFSSDELKSVFSALEFSQRTEPEKVEAVIRIRSQHEAEAVMSFVRGKLTKFRQLRAGFAQRSPASSPSPSHPPANDSGQRHEPYPDSDAAGPGAALRPRPSFLAG